MSGRSPVILALVLAGRWMGAKKRTAAAVTSLVGLAPKTARVLRDALGSGERSAVEWFVAALFVKVSRSRTGSLSPAMGGVKE